MLRGGSWPGELSCERVGWTRKSSGRRLLVYLACGKAQEEHLILRWSDDDYDGADDDSASAGVVHSQSSSCCTSPDCSSNTGGQQSYYSPSSERCPIDQEFLPILTNQERGVQNLEFILQQMHTRLTDLPSGEVNDIVANSRKNPLEGGREIFFALSFLRNYALFWNSKRELNAGSPTCLATRRR